MPSLDNHHLLNQGQIIQQNVPFSHFCLVFCNHQPFVTDIIMNVGMAGRCHGMTDSRAASTKKGFLVAPV